MSSLALSRLSRKAWFLSAMERPLLRPEEEDELVDEADVWREWRLTCCPADGDKGGPAEAEGRGLYMSPSCKSGVTRGKVTAWVVHPYE